LSLTRSDDSSRSNWAKDNRIFRVSRGLKAPRAQNATVRQGAPLSVTGLVLVKEGVETWVAQKFARL
jgi:hypothetical protein